MCRVVQVAAGDLEGFDGKGAAGGVVQGEGGAAAAQAGAGNVPFAGEQGLVAEDDAFDVASDDGVVGAAHADVGLVGGAAGQDGGVGGGDVGVCAQNGGDLAVEGTAEGDFF